jgi:hypothetical protein
MTTAEEREVTKFVLWGGPEDGLEVDVLSGNMQVVVDSPSAQTSRNRPFGAASSAPLPPLRKARYVYVKTSNRFEWKGYLP